MLEFNGFITAGAEVHLSILIPAGRSEDANFFALVWEQTLLKLADVV